LHVLDFLLGGVIAHTSHHISNGLERYLAVQFSRFGGVLVLRSNLTVIKEILEIRHSLTGGSSF
jgi:hypothetical protein